MKIGSSSSYIRFPTSSDKLRLPLTLNVVPHDNDGFASIMFSQLHNERMTASLDGDFVVFLIGMRVNKPLRIDKWLPVVTAMTRMIAELRAQPALGLLHAEMWTVSHFHHGAVLALDGSAAGLREEQKRATPACVARIQQSSRE